MLSILDIVHAQLVDLNIQDNNLNDNTLNDALRMAVASVDTELMLAQVSILDHSCDYSGLIQVIDHTSAACFANKLLDFRFACFQFIISKTEVVAVFFCVLWLWL